MNTSKRRVRRPKRNPPAAAATAVECAQQIRISNLRKHINSLATVRHGPDAKLITALYPGETGNIPTYLLVKPSDGSIPNFKILLSTTNLALMHQILAADIGTLLKRNNIELRTEGIEREGSGMVEVYNKITGERLDVYLDLDFARLGEASR